MEFISGQYPGQNTRSLTGEQPGTEIGVDGSLEAFAFEREFGAVALEDVEGQWRTMAESKSERSFRVRQRSSSKETSSCQCRLFSIPQWARVALGIAAGSAGKDAM